MASQCSRASRSQSSSQFTPVVCFHGVKAVLRVSGTKENPRRRFWGCMYYRVQDHCKFFQWAEPETENAEEDSEKVRMRRKIGCLKMKVKKAEYRMKIAVVFGVVGWVGMLFLWMQNYARHSPCFQNPAGCKGLY
ncbi:hypothetical protein PIB30_007591 [Stylosanthes scabra]|uniref:GRF-type domain-containing protein n=1 Tax=Stylosanthes scabra TaxID=79078 RepID=A0ABU6U6I0_9FABA|nr:hypothetical protein [Stylosanthes scabra]